MATSTPNWSGYLDGVWAWPIESSEFLPLLAGASNIVVGQNPPYTIQDFLGFYPKWGGTPLPIQATTSIGEPVVAVDDASGVAIGNYLAGPGIADGSSIIAIDTTDSPNTVTLSLPATADGSEVQVMVWTAPLVPFALINAYIYIASSSLVQARWLELWGFGMALYVAHFLTLYARSDGGTNVTLAQAAAQGLATGITVAKAVHDVSISYQPVQGLESWGAWNLTQYGELLATYGKAIGSGGMLLW